MPACAVKGCKNYSKKTKGTDIMYFSFPRDEELCNVWINVCEAKNIKLGDARICSRHFPEDSFEESYLLKRKFGYPISRVRGLRPDAIPQLYLPIVTDKPSTSDLPQEHTQVQVFVKSAIPKQELHHTAAGFHRFTTEVESLREENLQLKERIKILEDQNLIYVKILKRYFTEGQIRCMKTNSSKVHWPADDG